MRMLIPAFATLLMASAAVAAPISGKEAKSMVFSPKGAQVEMMPGDALSPENAKLLGQLAAGYAYYAAVALAPDEDLLKSEATNVAANFNSPEAAAEAALATCNKVRKGGRPCVVVGLVKPKGWKPQPFQLSVEGTVALQSAYGKQGVKAMATSASTGAFGLGVDAAAAVAACAAKGPADCAVVVAD